MIQNVIQIDSSLHQLQIGNIQNDRQAGLYLLELALKYQIPVPMVWYVLYGHKGWGSRKKAKQRYERIKSYWDEGWSAREIEKITHCPYDTVRGILKRVYGIDFQDRKLRRNLKIRRLHKQLGLSYRQLAKACKTSKSTVERVINGKLQN